MASEPHADIPTDKLREAVGLKLGLAYVAWTSLRAMEPNPPFGGFQSPDDEIVKFLSAARSVFLRIETYCKKRKLPYKEWRSAWDKACTEEERALVKLLQRQRNI